MSVEFFMFLERRVYRAENTGGERWRVANPDTLEPVQKEESETDPMTWELTSSDRSGLETYCVEYFELSDPELVSLLIGCDCRRHKFQPLPLFVVDRPRGLPNDASKELRAWCQDTSAVVSWLAPTEILEYPLWEDLDFQEVVQTRKGEPVLTEYGDLMTLARRLIPNAPEFRLIFVAVRSPEISTKCREWRAIAVGGQQFLDG